MQTLSTDDICKSYRGRRVVNGVSLHINQGEVVGLLGPNGAGKTTSFYMIVGLIAPDIGRVLMDGTEITGVPMYLRARSYGISYIRTTKGYALSGGERCRVEIARCLCIRPAFILLDEPFSGIDPIAVLDLQKIIFDLKASGIGVLITDHNVRETLSVTDRPKIINKEKIFRSGIPKKRGNDPEVKRVYLGESFSLV